MRLVTISIGLCVLAGPASTDVIWLEAEQFADTGGWVNDPQFVDLMGSPFLLAGGIGTPVEDAVTAARVSAAGGYRLWVRCRDWLPEHSPGTFEVHVNGRASDTTFGAAESDRWQWIDGGLFALERGEVEVRLHDTSGWWARCDAVVLTTEGKPANGLGRLAELRIRHGGLSEGVERAGRYDLVVVGGGLAGCGTAVAAARHGLKVALIQDRPVLGGNASSEIAVPPGGDQSREPLDPGETGIIAELDPGPRKGGRSDLYEKVVRAEPNVDLHLNTRATGVRMLDRNTIGSVLVANVRTGERTEFVGALFADCTGDGWVGFWAGADFRQGREGRKEFGEPLAPPKPDKRGMSTSLYNATIVARAGPADFEGPPWAYNWESPEDFEQKSMAAVHSPGDAPPGSFDDLSTGGGRRPSDPLGAVRHTWWVELGGMDDRIRDAEMIRDELFRVHVGLWDYAKNHDPKHSEANRNRELVWVNHIAGKRESRRLMGDYILTQRDYAEKTVHPDNVAYGGWSIDIHHPQGFWTAGNQYYHAYFQKISIPYRSLYSRNIDNLFMAGRDISVSHVALGGVRVMRTTCLMGQAVGTAAAVARAHEATPRGVYQEHLAELQQTLLRDGCYLMGVPNRDPEDLALGATVTASSVASIPDPEAAEKLPNRGAVHDLTTSRAFMFTAKHDRLDSVDLFLRSERTEPTELTLTLRRAKKLADFSSSKDLAVAKGTVPAESAGWVSFPLQTKLKPGNVYWAWLPAAPGLQWDLYEFFPEGTWRAYGGPNWTAMSHCYKHRLTPGGEPGRPGDWQPPGEVDLEPWNVVDGWNRAVHGVPHSWGPAEEEAPPHWVEVRFDGEKSFDTLHLTFQTQGTAASFYNLAVPDGDGWRRVLEVGGNTERRRVHEFDRVTTDRLRITFTGAPHSDEQVRVCEVRVYGEGG